MVYNRRRYKKLILILVNVCQVYLKKLIHQAVANVAMLTRALVFEMMDAAQASSVDPVVTTSSISNMCFPEKDSGWES